MVKEAVASTSVSQNRFTILQNIDTSPAEAAEVEILHEQFIHCKVDIPISKYQTYLTIVYAKNEGKKREILWHELVQLGSNIAENCLLCGDSNNVLITEDRIGSHVLPHKVDKFQTCIDTLGLTSLKSKGCYYTFSNRQEADSRVYSKIDWAFENSQWLTKYRHIEAEFLPAGVSDHSPILVAICPQPKVGPKPFKLYMTVMKHPDFGRILERARCTKLKTSRNSITTVYDDMGNKLEISVLVEAKLIKFFSNLMGTAAEQLPCPNISVIRTVKGMPQEKAPGIDGYPAEFLKLNWSIVKLDVICAVKEFFESGKLLKAFIFTAVTLIPKVANPTYVKDYRPIACCTTIYKIITRILTNRLKNIVKHIVNPSQSAFVEEYRELVVAGQKRFNGPLTRPKRNLQWELLSPVFLIKTINSLESWNGGVLVVVSGSVKLKDFNGWMNFVQTFLLSPQEKGYFVLNDVFHFVNEEGSELAQAPVVSQNNLDAQPISSNPLAEPPDAKPALLEAFNNEYTERRQKVAPALLNACDVLANFHFMSVIFFHLLVPFVL
ncbi:hypothetical protein FXO37_33124 [Capsicum annuum]|nr:hypothetical protein FXO37_33124 [Capsicum annuum]